jgi:multicomponent Na+:H+ antiporter subunit D
MLAMLLIEQFPVLIVTVAMFVGYTILLAGYLKRSSAYYISIGSNVIFFIMSLFVLRYVLTEGPIKYWQGGWRPPWGIEYVVDAMNAYLLVVLFFIVVLMEIYFKRNVEKEIEGRKHPTFYALVQLMVAGLAGITVTGDLFNLFVWLEIASLTVYALVAVAGGRALRASYNYVIMGSIGAVFYIFGVGWIYSVTGTLNMADMRLLLPTIYDNRAVQLAFAFIVVGIMIKAYIFPLHLWQPDAYTYAPSSISAMVASIHGKVMIYILIRLVFSVFTLDFVRYYIGLDLLICWVAAIGILAGSYFAIKQRNLKRMLAYSSVAQFGYIMLGIGLSPISPWGLVGAAAHILNHAVMKGCLFMTAGSFIHKEGLRDIRHFEGLSKRMPFTSAAFAIAAISIIGLPPTAGFASKLFLILASLDAAQYPFVAVLLLSGLLNLVYFWRVIDRIYFVRHAEPAEKEEKRTGYELPLSMLAPMMVLASLCIILGLLWLTDIPLPLINHILSNLRTGGSL